MDFGRLPIIGRLTAGLLAFMQVDGHNCAMGQKSVSDQLRITIQRCGKTRYRLSLDSGVSQSALSRFITGESELTIANAEKLCKAIGVQLVIKVRKTK